MIYHSLRRIGLSPDEVLMWLFYRVFFRAAVITRVGTSPQRRTAYLTPRIL